MDFKYSQNRIYLSDGQGNTLAEVTWKDLGSQTIEINHTYVDDSLRGQGVAGKLMKAAADRLRSQNMKAVPTCSYAVKWFEKHPEYKELLK